MAADWTYQPEVEGFELDDHEPVTLSSRYEDNRENTRRKSVSFWREWGETYIWTAAEADAARDFWRTKGVDVAFVKYSWDPREAAAAEATAKFSAFTCTASGAIWVGRCRFREVTT